MRPSDGERELNGSLCFALLVSSRPVPPHICTNKQILALAPLTRTHQTNNQTGFTPKS